MEQVGLATLGRSVWQNGIAQERPRSPFHCECTCQNQRDVQSGSALEVPASPFRRWGGKRQNALQAVLRWVKRPVLLYFPAMISVVSCREMVRCFNKVLIVNAVQCKPKSKADFYSFFVRMSIDILPSNQGQFHTSANQIMSQPQYTSTQSCHWKVSKLKVSSLFVQNKLHAAGRLLWSRLLADFFGFDYNRYFRVSDPVESVVPVGQVSSRDS